MTVMKNKRILFHATTILLVVLSISGYFHIPKYEIVEAGKIDTEAVIESSFDYEVRVNKDTLLWSSGEILEKGMPLYFYALEPGLTVYPALKMDNPSRGEVKVEVFLEAGDKDKNVYWSKFIKNQQTGTTYVGFTELSPIEIDPFELLELADGIAEDLEIQKARMGNLYILISLQAELEKESINHDIRFTLDSHGIIPPPDDQLSAREEIRAESTVKISEKRTLNDYLSCSYFWTYSGAFSLLFATAFISLKKEPKNSYRRYNSWVSRARLNSNKEPDAYFESLKELIDTAVELDKKVIYDPGREIYYLLDGDNMYAHVKKIEQALTRKRSRD